MVECQWLGRREDRGVYFKCGVWYVLIVGCVECGPVGAKRVGGGGGRQRDYECKEFVTTGEF